MGRLLHYVNFSFGEELDKVSQNVKVKNTLHWAEGATGQCSLVIFLLEASLSPVAFVTLVPCFHSTADTAHKERAHSDRALCPGTGVSVAGKMTISGSEIDLLHGLRQDTPSSCLSFLHP